MMNNTKGKENQNLKTKATPKCSPSDDNDLNLTQGWDWWICGAIQKESEEAAGEISFSFNHRDLVIGDIKVVIGDVDSNMVIDQAPSKPVRKQKRRQQDGDARLGWSSYP